MTPRLIPYSWFRFVVPPLIGGAATLVAWWVTLVEIHLHHQRALLKGGLWSPETEGAWMLCHVAAAAAMCSILLEGRFEHTPTRRRFFVALFTGAMAFFCTWLGNYLYAWLMGWMQVIPAGSLALRWRLGPWMIAATATSCALVKTRSFRHVVNRCQERYKLQLFDPPKPTDLPIRTWVFLHVTTGMSAGMLGAVTWYFLGLWLDDLFLAAAGGSWVFGAVCGALLWSIPDRLYQGWLSVRIGARPGWRIPFEHTQPALAERFLGHFPSGMDLHLPARDAVAEVHLSVLVREPGRWAARGLSQQLVGVVRPLERIDLTWDPTLPAPLETSLRHEDRIRLGASTELELLVLPREGEP